MRGQSTATIFLGGLFLLLIAVILFQVVTSRPRKRNRRLVHNLDGEVVAMGNFATDTPYKLEGEGVLTSNIVELTEGKYVMNYHLDGMTRITLLNEKSLEKKGVIISMGAGVKEFSVHEDAPYRWFIEPNEKDKAWRIVYRRILKSKRR